MAAIATRDLRRSYGSVTALRGVSWSVPEGALYALLGPNGAGKTTLLRAAAGTLRPTSGVVRTLGRDSGSLRPADRQEIGWVAESQRLPRWMTVAQLESWVAPLYARWDAALAGELRARFELDPARRIGHLSRGQQMKAALLCALAPRPRLLLMDEPFTGMDVVVKDEIVQGLLETCGEEGWTVVISSHDLAELELLADHVGFLQDGQLLLSAPADEVRARYLHVEAVLPAGAPAPAAHAGLLSMERAGSRLRLVADLVELGGTDGVAELLAGCEQVESRAATLRELFIALARRSGHGRSPSAQEVSA